MPSDLPTNRPEDPTEPVDLFRLAWGFYLILAIAGVVWVGSSQGSIPLEVFLDPASWWIDVALGISAGLLLVLAWDLGRRFVPAMRELEELLAQHIGPLDSAQVFALAVISGFSEELFFRGAVQHSWGIGWATIIFTLMHFGPGHVYRWWTLFAFVAALIFGGLVVYRGNILSAVLAHVVVNAINLRRLAASPTQTD